MRQSINKKYQSVMNIFLKQRERTIIFWQFFCFYLVGFGIMMNRHYSPDSFIYSSRSALHYKEHLSTARIGAYVAAFLFKDIDITKYQIWFALLLILTITLSATILYNHYIQWISDDKRKRFLLKMAVILMYGNVYMTDFFHFPEAIPPMAFGILFMTFAVQQIVPNMSIKKLLTMTLFMIISLNCYQVTLGFFCFFALASIYIANKGILTKNAFIDSFLIVLFGGLFAGATNVILLRILQNTGVVAQTNRTEMAGLEGWISNAKRIAQGAYYFFKDTSKFLPKNSIIFILLLLYALVITTLWNAKASWRNYLYILLMVLVCRVMVYAPHILASDVWMAPRTIISYWSIVSIPCIVLVVLSNRHIIKNIALVFMICFCIVQALSIQRIGLNMISKDRIDEEISYMIQSKIADYESKSGTEIDTIIFRNDMIPSYQYRSSEFGAFELGQRAFTVPWGCVEMINYFNDENYSYIYMDDEIFKRYFDKENWDYLNLDEQLVFDGNVAYFIAF